MSWWTKNRKKVGLLGAALAAPYLLPMIGSGAAGLLGAGEAAAGVGAAEGAAAGLLGAEGAAAAAGAEAAGLAGAAEGAAAAKSGLLSGMDLAADGMKMAYSNPFDKAMGIAKIKATDPATYGKLGKMMLMNGMQPQQEAPQETAFSPMSQQPMMNDQQQPMTEQEKRMRQLMARRYDFFGGGYGR